MAALCRRKLQKRERVQVPPPSTNQPRRDSSSRAHPRFQRGDTHRWCLVSELARATWHRAQRVEAPHQFSVVSSTDQSRGVLGLWLRVRILHDAPVSTARRGVSSLPPLNFPRHARKAGGFSSPTSLHVRAFSCVSRYHFDSYSRLFHKRRDLTSLIFWRAP